MATAIGLVLTLMGPTAFADLIAELTILIRILAVGLVVLAFFDLRKLYWKIDGRQPTGPGLLSDITIKLVRITLPAMAAVLLGYTDLMDLHEDLKDHFSQLDSPGIEVPETQPPEPRPPESEIPGT